MADELGVAGVTDQSTSESTGFAGPQIETTDGAGEGTDAAPEPLDPSYVSRAQTFNLTEDDLRAVPRAVVERMLAGADRAMIEAFRREQTYRQEPPYQDPATAAPQVPPTDFAFDPFEVKFDADAEVGEPIVKNMTAQQKWAADQLTKLHTRYEAKIAAQEKKFREFADGVTRREDYAILDRYIDGLGPEWSGVFGKGPRLELDPRSQEFLKSDELRMAAIETMQAHARMTGRPLPVSQALSRALNAMFYEKAAAIERAKADAKRKELQATAGVRPKASGGAPQNGGIRARATRLVEAMRQ